MTCAIRVSCLCATGALLSSVPVSGETGAAPRGDPEPIVHWDLTHLFSLNLRQAGHLRLFHDTAHFAASLQGIVNRSGPRLFIRFNQEPDDFWWDLMTRPGGWLEGRRVLKVRRTDEVLEHFRKDIKGAVAWDERVPATSNVASTVAGCEDLVCLRHDDSPGSLYAELTGGGSGLQVARRLIAGDGSPMFQGKGRIPGTEIPSSGSAKCDAYLWAAHHYLETGKCDPTRMGYYLDGYWLKSWRASDPRNHTLTNHDYVIAKRGFLFDLGVWDDETPIDDADQKPGTDAETLRAILRTACDRLGGDGMIHVAGFVPWAYKYTSVGSAGGKHDPVPTEWKFAEILSCFDSFMDADALGSASMANASFFQHYPLEKRYGQNPKPNLSSMRERGYVDERGRVIPKRYFAFYVGDYDSAAWMYWWVPKLWGDPERGTVPLSWAFNPNLCERNPLAMVHTRETRSANDFFVAGDSGAGYLNPGLLTPPRPHSGLPSGLDAWTRHCAAFYRQWDITLTGFIIDGNGPGLSPEGLAAYAQFSADGVVPQKIERQGVFGKMPFLRTSGDLPDDEAAAAKVIAGRFGETRPQFITFRSILKSPSWYARVAGMVRAQSGEDPIEIVDMYTLLWLVRQSELGADSRLHVESRYSSARRVRCSPGSTDGARAVYFADGPFDTADVSGRRAWRVPAHQPGYYLYFEVDDRFHHRERVPVEIRLVYLDSGGGRFCLQYDSFDPQGSHDGIYKEAQWVERGDSGEWKTAVWKLHDARFGDLQNGDCDFRIFAAGAELVIAELEVKKAAQP